jgi:hypothetical protein
MTNEHKIALFNPCRYESERHKKLFAARKRFGESEIVVTLTVNDFGGSPRWQAAAHLIARPGEPVNLFVKMPRPALRAVERHLLDLLEPVGRGVVWHFNTIREINYFKSLSRDELQHL